MDKNNIKILDFLDLNCPDLEILDLEIIDSSVKQITVAKRLTETYCPVCGSRMHSKGFTTRRAKHSILQDGFKVIVLIKVRRWECSCDSCNGKLSDKFIFIDDNKQTTKVTDICILNALRDWDRTTASIARQYNVSDTYVFELFDMYFEPDRLALPEVLSVDEVYVNIPGMSKYALILNDFIEREPVDMVESRLGKITEQYFADIPAEERNRVKYLITDMYKPYLAYIDRYFPNAVPIVDSFHVVSLITRMLNNHMVKLQKKYRTSREAENEKRIERGEKPLPESMEEYMLKNYRWLVLKNQTNIKYHTSTKYNKKLRQYMNTSDYETLLFKIAPELKEMRDLKEKYISFNSRYRDDLQGAGKRIDELIEEYSGCRYVIFRQFAKTLKEYREPIINSFITVTRTVKGRQKKVRMSNGPIEGMNRFVKDMKRNARGFRNYYHLRKRFLFSRRSPKNAPILGTPKTKAEIHNSTGKKRGPYKKNK